MIDFFIPYSNQFIIIKGILIICTIALIYININQQNKISRKSIGYNFLPLILVVLSIFILAFPMVKTHSASEMVRFLSSGEDNASHFAMFNRSVTTHSTPYFDHQPTGLIDSLKIYPQGIHTFAAYSYWSIFGNRNYSVYTLLKMYYLVTIVLCASLVFITGMIINSLSSDKFRNTAIISGSITVFTGAILFLAGWGFITQITALVYLLSVLYLLIIQSKQKKITKDTLILISFLYSALFIGITFSWFLMLPIAFAGIIQHLLKAIKITLYPTLILIVLTIIAIIPPILLNVIGGKGSGAINEPGGVYIYGKFAYLIFIVGIIILVYYSIKRRFYENNLGNNSILQFIGASFFLSSIVGVYQLITVGSLRYYYYKSLYIIFILSTILILIHLSNLAKKIKTVRIFNSLFIILFIASYFVISPTYPIVYVRNWFNHSLQPDSINDALVIRENKITKDVIYYSKCNNITEYTLNRWTGAIFLSETKNRRSIANKSFYNLPRENDIKSYIRHTPNSIEIIYLCDLKN